MPRPHGVSKCQIEYPRRGGVWVWWPYCYCIPGLVAACGLGWAGGWMRFLTCQFCHWLALGTRHSALHHFLFHITRPQHLGMGPPTLDRQELPFHLTPETTHAVCTYIITNNINIIKLSAMLLVPSFQSSKWYLPKMWDMRLLAGVRGFSCCQSAEWRGHNATWRAIVYSIRRRFAKIMKRTLLGPSHG